MWRPRRPGAALCPLVRSVPCARAIFTRWCVGHGTRGVGRDPAPRGSPGPRASCGSEVDVVLRERPPCETSRRPRDGRGGRLRAGRCRASVDVRCVCVHRARAPGGRLLSCSDSMVSNKVKKPCFVTRRRSLTSSQNSARHTGRSYYGYTIGSFSRGARRDRLCVLRVYSSAPLHAPACAVPSQAHGA